MTREKEENQGRRTTDQISWKSPFGWIQVSGKTAVIAAMIVALGYVVWRHDDRSEKQSERASEQNQATVEALREMAFVMTLSEPERKALNLAMPASMRERLLRQERERRGTEYRRYDQ